MSGLALFKCLVLAKVKTCTISGIEAALVEVEVQVCGGMPGFTIIGLADSAVRESRDRVMSAITHSGFALPEHILVNLAPAEIRKEGSSFDLPIALGILAASNQLNRSRLETLTFHGELSLDGRIKPVRGILCFALRSAAYGAEEVVVPYENRDETVLVHGLKVTAAGSLAELVHYLNDGVEPSQPAFSDPRPASSASSAGLAEVWGQESAKRAMLIAAAGGHNLLMIGPPGCGKSMLAQRFPGLLPPLAEWEMLEAARIHSIAGAALRPLLNGERPFRSPHHVITDVGLVGGGSSPRPGEISMAHNGVLFLDEFPEFRRSALESLRSPLETGEVHITRAKGSLIYPARFQLLAAMNPCPCGRLGVRASRADQSCLCSRPVLSAYLRKLSQPILDRIDMHVELEAVPPSAMLAQMGGAVEGDAEELRTLVASARARQRARQGKLNSCLTSKEWRQAVCVEATALDLLEQALQTQNLSARSCVRALRMATTIADLSRSGRIAKEHVAEALGFRGLERLQRYANGAAV